ncbi:MAG: 2-dehydropantoate 2-reductase [Candidatus Omnitrophica bacterium]|nr:2-dehydropantoate 2-reductase [Candidatus Omnitrophota bacterium]
MNLSTDKGNWLVVGAGAIGSVVGGLLAKSGQRVCLLGRPWHLDEVRRNGLVLRGILGEHQIRDCRVALEFEELPRETWDVVLVTVKSNDTLEAARGLADRIQSSTQVISLQNGLGNWETLAEHLPVSQLVGGRVIFGVELEPGVATVTVWGGDILLGALAPALPLERLKPIAEGLTSAGLKTQVTDRIREALWSKVIYNCALNPLSTLLEVPYGRLLETEATRHLMRGVVKESYQVGRAEGMDLAPSTAEEYSKELFDRLIPATAAHHPSMLQDLRRRKKTEIGALNGAIVRMGIRHRIPTPVNGLLTDLIRAKETLGLSAVQIKDRIASLKKQ